MSPSKLVISSVFADTQPFSFLLPPQGLKMKERIGADKYLECSAKKNLGVREVFEAATKAALAIKYKKKKVTTQS